METRDPRQMLALSYAPPAARTGVAALFDLDAKLGGILRGTSEPMVGQMRLTWWHEALTRLDSAPAPAEPVLQALAAEVLPRGVRGAQLAALVEGWEALLDEELGEPETLNRYAARGTSLFGLAARLCGAAPTDPVVPAGRGWALADLAAHVSDRQVAERAQAGAVMALDHANAARWSREGRALGALALMARHDLAGRSGSAAGVRHVLRLVWHRLTGR